MNPFAGALFDRQEKQEVWTGEWQQVYKHRLWNKGLTNSAGMLSQATGFNSGGYSQVSSGSWPYI